MNVKNNDSLKNKQIDSVDSDLKDIFNKYECIHFKISNKPQSDNFVFEINLLNEVETLINQIQASVLQHNSSKVSEEIGCTPIENILYNLLTIKEFLSCLIKYGRASKDDEDASLIKKDMITKRAEDELYNFLLNIIGALYPIQYDSPLEPSITNLKSTFKLSISEIDKQNIEATINHKIRTKILKTRSKHFSQFFNECYILESRLSKAIKSIEGSKAEKELYDKNKMIIQKIHESIINDDLKKAKQLVIEIEDTLTTQ